jgi:hypothetical protein
MTSPSPLERLAGPGNVLGKEAPDTKEFVTASGSVAYEQIGRRGRDDATRPVSAFRTNVLHLTTAMFSRDTEE